MSQATLERVPFSPFTPDQGPNHRVPNREDLRAIQEGFTPPMMLGEDENRFSIAVPLLSEKTLGTKTIPYVYWGKMVPGSNEEKDEATGEPEQVVRLLPGEKDLLFVTEPNSRVRIEWQDDKGSVSSSVAVKTGEIEGRFRITNDFITLANHIDEIDAKGKAQILINEDGHVETMNAQDNVYIETPGGQIHYVPAPVEKADGTARPPIEAFHISGNGVILNGYKLYSPTSQDEMYPIKGYEAVYDDLVSKNGKLYTGEYTWSQLMGMRETRERTSRFRWLCRDGQNRLEKILNISTIAKNRQKMDLLKQNATPVNPLRTQTETAPRGLVHTVEPVVWSGKYINPYIVDTFHTAGITSPSQIDVSVAHVITLAINDIEKTPPKGTKLKMLTPEALQVLSERAFHPEVNQSVTELLNNPELHLRAYQHVSEMAKINSKRAGKILSQIHRVLNAHLAEERAQAAEQTSQERERAINELRRSIQLNGSTIFSSTEQPQAGKDGELVEPQFEPGNQTLRYRTPDGTIWISRPDAGSPYPEVRVVSTEKGYQVTLSSERPLKEVILRGAADIDATQVPLIKSLHVVGGTIDTGSVQNLRLIGTATIRDLEGSSEVVGRSRLVVRGALGGRLRVHGPEEIVSDSEQPEATQLPLYNQVIEDERRRRETERMRRVVAAGERWDTDQATVLINHITHRGNLEIWGDAGVVVGDAKAEQIVVNGDRAKVRLINISSER